MAENIEPATLVRRFYDLRRNGDPTKLRTAMHADVVWREPEVGDHMGKLRGVDAVIDMMQRASLTTGGSFRLDVESTAATGSDCAAVIRWSAKKGERRIDGRELAIFRFEKGLILEALFFPETIENDHAFWA